MPDSDRSYSRIVGDWILTVMRISDKEDPYYDEVEIKVGEHEKIRPFFVAAMRDRFKWYLLAFIAAFVFTLATRGANVNPVQVMGLLLDLIGAFILGVGLLRSDIGIERDSIKNTEAAAGLYTNSNGNADSEEYRDPLSVSSEARDTVDGLAGVSFLMIGFSLQIFVVLS